MQFFLSDIPNGTNLLIEADSEENPIANKP